MFCNVYFIFYENEVCFAMCMKTNFVYVFYKNMFAMLLFLKNKFAILLNSKINTDKNDRFGNLFKSGYTFFPLFNRDSIHIMDYSNF